MSSAKCLQCGGGGSLNWYECICHAPPASHESIEAVNGSFTRWMQTNERFKAVIKPPKYNYDYLTDNEVAALNFDASIVLICDYRDNNPSKILSDWLFYKGLVSTADGFCVLPVDADNAFTIRAVSVKNLGDEGCEELFELFRTLPWENRPVARLTVQMNGASYTASAEADWP